MSVFIGSGNFAVIKNYIIMKNYCKYLFGILIIAFGSTNCFSQNESPIQFGVDLMNRYIWRGVDLGGESPSIQPSLKYVWNSKDSNHSLVLGAWGAYNFATTNQEADLYFTYTYKNLVSFTFTDYYFPGLYGNDSSKGKYFNYKKTQLVMYLNLQSILLVQKNFHSHYCFL